MFKHRLFKFCVSLLFAMPMLLVGGSLQSCQDWLDVYPYDDPGDPEWLGPNIYDFLKEGTNGHRYTNFVTIIDSLGEKSTLSRTGSKTLFVADDAAFERFFNGGNNVWGVKNVGEMTKAQMKYILYNSMLDNAMLLEMLSSTGAGEDKEGLRLRRETSTNIIDSIPVVSGDSYASHENWPTYNKYWDALRGKERTEKMRLAMDGTTTMMVHFISDYLKKNAIKPSDIEFLFKKKGETGKTFADGDAFIFGNKLVSSGVDTDGFSDDIMTITCKNGYIYRMDDVLLTPSNMANELRKHPDVTIFSHLLDRFCVPDYNENLSREFNAYYKTNDSVYELRYFVEGSFSSHNLLADSLNPKSEDKLILDPGRNNNGEITDMAAMLVPNDDALYEYFAHPDSAGHFLLERFAPDVEVNDVKTLMSALDRVPERNIAPFINNLLRTSFKSTVASKFDKIVDDANELMNVKEHHVDECVIANNGVIYILNSVFGPGEYQAVSAPTLVYDNMGVMNKMIEQLKYNYYLLAMDVNYSLIVPDDNHFIYYDPLTTNGKEPKVYSFHYDTKHPKARGEKKFWAKVNKFNIDNYEFKDSLNTITYGVDSDEKYFNGSAEDDKAFAENRLGDLLAYLVLVHKGEQGIYAGNKYFLTKGFGTIKIDATDPNNIKMYGGEQLERGTSVVVSSINKQKNGMTYCVVPGQEDEGKIKYSSVPTPPTKSVYDNLLEQAEEEDDLFYEFYHQCYPGDDYASSAEDGFLMKLFNITNNSDNKLAKYARNYSVFYTNTDNVEDFSLRSVSFFNIFHYTVYAPSNEAIRELRERGLPTWEQVRATAEKGQKAKTISLITSIVNFARYHVQDNSVFVDNLPLETFNPSTEETLNHKAYQTAMKNPNTNRFYELQLSNDDRSTITITDDLGKEHNVITKGVENKDWNIMCRDNIYKSAGKGASAELNLVKSSSFAVLHPIDGALLNKSMFGYDGRFKRFASDGPVVDSEANGALVDTMYVDGTGAVEVGDSTYYLVAKLGNLKLKNAEGKQEIHKTGFLMSVLEPGDAEYDEMLTREKLIALDKAVEKGDDTGVETTAESESEPAKEYVLVTDEGFRIEKVFDEDGKFLSYEYVTEEENGIIYILRYNNDATLKERVKIGEVAPEEDEDETEGKDEEVEEDKTETETDSEVETETETN